MFPLLPPEINSAMAKGGWQIARQIVVSHPTVKPLELMRWLVRLVTPAGGVVIDPFAGSGTTAEACHVETCAALLPSARRIMCR